LPPGVVPFPRGFAFGHDGRLFLASGMGPDGQGDALQLFPCVGQAEKDLAVQAFIPKPAVEALDITVLHGTARPDEVEFHPGLMRPGIHRLTGKLAAVVQATLEW